MAWSAGSVYSYSLDKTSGGTGFGAASISSGTTAALSDSDDLVVAIISYDDGVGTNPITMEALSPTWNDTVTTVYQTVLGSDRSTVRWRSPGVNTGVRANAAITGPNPDYCDIIYAIQAQLPPNPDIPLRHKTKRMKRVRYAY
jgi:hypothetical protein